MATWRDKLSKQFEEVGDSWENVVHIAPHASVLDEEFYDGYGGAEGPSFTVWTSTYVYFPLEYDGYEYVGHAPRFPSPIAMKHQ